MTNLSAIFTNSLTSQLMVAVILVITLLGQASAAEKSLSDHAESFTPEIFYTSEESIGNAIDKIMALPDESWKSSGKKKFNQGYTEQPFWLRFSLVESNISSLNQLIEITYPHLDIVSFYQVREGVIIQSFQTGDHYTFDQRPIEHAHFLFPIKTARLDKDVFYLRVQTSGTLQVPVIAWDSLSFFEQSLKVEQTHAVYYGILLVIIFFNLIIYVTLKEVTYLYYGLSTFGYLILIATLRGKTFQVFWPQFPAVQEMIMLVSIPFALLFSLLFARSFLSLATNNPSYDKFLKVLVWLSLLSTLGCLVLPYHNSIQVSVLLAVPGCLALLVVGPIQWYRGQYAARLYTIAWAMLTTGGTLAALNKAGVIPINFITEYAIELGSALEAMILSIALAERLYREREDKVKAQASTIKEHNERRNAELTVIRQALTHPVTKLPNHAHFEMCINNWINQEPETPFAVIIIKISTFNEVNNTLGYGSADKLLIKLAARINQLAEQAPGVRILEKTEAKNFYVASFEGAVFALALDLKTWRENEPELRKFLKRLSTPTEFGGMILELPAHVGTANFPEDGADASTLIRRANVAVEFAYKYEDHVAHYRPHQDPYNAKKLTLISELKRAIQEDLLELYLQPKIDLKTNQVIGLESLLRWEHPSFGFIPPDEFVQVAEQSGIIKPLTRWVFHKALVQLKILENKGIRLNTAINISPNNLKESDFSDFIKGVMEELAVKPSQITLELTETSMMADPLKALEALNQLHQTGVNLSIDDFGTGYSSLSYIKKVPAQEIKIDKSLVFDIDQETDDEVLVRTTVNMCHDLGFKVVAEGVENEAVRDKLLAMNCDWVQGFFYTKPLPIHEFISWYQEYLSKPA